LPNFSDLGLSGRILGAVAAEGYTAPTPIQSQAIPPILDGRDLCGIAQTGTGKTAAFALPILQRLAALSQRAVRQTCRALVLRPTRELASQIADSFRAYGVGMPLLTAVVFGGVPIGPQRQKLARGVDILVATPGRLLDLIDTGSLTLSSVQVLVLDEADRMLDLGFIHALKRIVKLLPRQRQTLLFSATMPRPIAVLAENYLKDPVQVVVAPAATTVERVEQEGSSCWVIGSGICLRRYCAIRSSRACSFLPEPSTALIASCVTWSPSASRRPPFTATNPSRSANVR
jgi:ATP-dependent RNA helicase RhlE